MRLFNTTFPQNYTHFIPELNKMRIDLQNH
jgi:hypothetical protein